VRLFDSDLVRCVTDTTSFDVDALIEGKPMSLYIIVPPARLSAYRPMLRMWLTGLMLAMTQRKAMPNALVGCNSLELLAERSSTEYLWRAGDDAP
jgi:type IV secretion system protein VirD4